MHKRGGKYGKITCCIIFEVRVICGGHPQRIGLGISLDPTADSDSIANGEHADFNPGVSSKGLVELQDEVSVIPNVLPKGSIRWRHDGSVPQGVVVPDHPSNLHQLNQPLVVVQVVVLISVHKYEVKGPMVLLLRFTTRNH